MDLALSFCNKFFKKKSVKLVAFLEKFILKCYLIDENCKNLTSVDLSLTVLKFKPTGLKMIQVILNISFLNIVNP